MERTTRARWEASGLAATLVASALVFGLPTSLDAATIVVAAGGDLQAALTAAEPGDTILLQPGTTYIGNFVLPVHGGHTHITLRSATDDALLPPYGTRISPEYSPLLARLKSPNDMPALATAPGAAFWTVMLLQFEPNTPTLNGGELLTGDIIALGSGSSAQSTLDAVPHDLVIDRVYVRGDPMIGQKRGIALNSALTTIVNSYIADIKAINQDTQAIGGWNGPGGYWIENNYLEASGDNVLIGGADPRIAGLVPSDIVFRGNTISRPVSWRAPILPTPANVVATATAGGLPAGTYAYRVVARGGPVLNTPLFSAASPQISVTLDAGGGVALEWAPVPGATGYRVYGRTPAGATQFWSVASPSFVDIGISGTAGSGVTATVWRVKNVFELKNARRVRVEFNIIENNWRQSQDGIPVLFTPRSQNGGCPWCVVEDVTFEHNIVRHAGGGVHVLGIDNASPTQQANDIRIRNNLFYDISRSWGGLGNIMLINQNPRDIKVDHNTFISRDGNAVVFAEGPQILGFVFTNNIARHNSFGIVGTGTGPGLPTINRYFPTGIFDGNVLAGGLARLYPPAPAFLFPTIPEFEGCFVDYPNLGYGLRPECPWSMMGLGADIATIMRGVDFPPRLVVKTTTLASGNIDVPYAASLAADGGHGEYKWTTCDGALPPGLSLNDETGNLSGTPTAGGTYQVCVRVTDDLEATAVQLVRISINRPPSAANQTVSTNHDVAVTFDLMVSDPDGDALIYTIGPPSNGTVSGTPPTVTYTPAPGFSGTDAFEYTVNDGHFSDTATVTITVFENPVAITRTSLPDGRVGRRYVKVIETTGGTLPFTWSVLGGALPPGLTLASATGQISGTPTTAGTFVSTLQVVDAVGSRDVVALTIVITPARH